MDKGLLQYNEEKKTVKKHIFTDNKSLIYNKKLLNETNDNIFIIIKMI